MFDLLDGSITPSLIGVLPKDLVPTLHGFMVAAAEGGEAGGGGIPQLNFEENQPLSQIFWFAVTFAFLYFMMARVALPRIAQVIEERHDKIAQDLDKAAEFEARTKEAIAAYETALSEARAKALRTVEETRKQVTAAMEQKRKDSEAKIEDRLRQAEERITATKDAALANVREVAGEVSSAIVSRLLNEEVSGNAIASAVDAELTTTPRL